MAGMAGNGSSFYQTLLAKPSQSRDSEQSPSPPHLVFIRAFEHGGISDFLTLVNDSFTHKDLDVVSATTAVHRLARWWSKNEKAKAEIVHRTLEILVLISRHLADIFRFKAEDCQGQPVQPRHFAITAWAFATLLRCRTLQLRGENLTGLFRPLAEAAVPRLPEFDGQSLGNLLWGFAVVQPVRQVHRRLFFVASRRAIQLLQSEELLGQNLSNVLWSFSQMRLANHALFEAVASRPDVFSGPVSSQHITNILWAFSRIHGKIGMFRTFCDAGAEAAIPKLQSFKTQELANLVWTFANQTLYHEGLFAAVAHHARGRIAQFENFDLSQLLWSFAKVWWRDVSLMQEAAQDMLCGPKQRLKYMCAQDLGCVLWAFAMLQWQDEELFKALAQAVREHFSTLKPLDVGNVAWALSVSKQMDFETAGLIADSALCEDFDTAEGWVHVLCALQPLAAKLSNRWEELLGRFEGRIFKPLCPLASLCQKLKELGLATRAINGSSNMLALREELGLLEAWVGELQLEHLGPDFTQRLASHCGFWSDGDWAEAARAVEAFQSFQKTSATHSAHSAEFWDATAFSESRASSVQSFRVGLHQSKVLAWVSYSLCLNSGLETACINQPGQIVTYGRAEREFCQHWQAAEKLLLPLVSTSHSRGGHAERVAMLQVFSAALKSADQLRGEKGTFDLVGEIWLYISHWPCISCLAVLCQAGIDHKDRAGCKEVYSKLRSAVEDGIEYLLSAREEDPFEDMPGRYAWEQVTGVQAPSFDLKGKFGRFKAGEASK
eukprot:s469_g35.t4